ncbi:MAG TPA: hypothetical protein VGQ57_02915, partial [Polyangiaceae bacterium]|nr:hypothetical protein [Polyangiaceae bacterium]
MEHGDWQTPPALAERVMELVARLEPDAKVVLEPTCGRGAFLAAARRAFPLARLEGFELSPEYAREARGVTGDANTQVTVADFFQTPWEQVLARWPEPFLIVGNPPWVTSATLGALSARNLPVKANFKRHAGLDAVTGKSNFDISEWMLRRLLEAARGRRFTLAMLCKASVARKLLERAAVERWELTGAVRLIDAKKHFSAAVSAVLLVLSSSVRGPAESADPAWDLYPSLESPAPHGRIGWREGRPCSDLDGYERTAVLAGPQERGWRSGVKHDLARVMELVREDGGLRNGLGERVEVEPEQLYPLLKGSALANAVEDSERFVIVTQRRLGEDTTALAARAPRTWSYLERHRALFEARKSRIYRGQPPFAMFGVGEYSFAPFKVAISGLHKRLAFRVVGPREGRPVLLDDTSYFLPCAGEPEARRAARLLASEPARRFF